MNDGETTMDTETGPSVREPARGPVVGRFVNANHKLVVYRTIALRMREGGSPEGIGRTIARMDQTQVPAEGKDIAHFSQLLAQRIEEAMKHLNAQQGDGGAAGLVLSVALDVFGELSFVEQVALDVPTDEIVASAMRSGDPERAMNRIVSDILRDTAQVLQLSIEPRK